MSDPNENRAGYKETKVGWIPDAWEAAQYQDVTVFSGGYGFPEDLQNEAAEGVPFIKVSDMNRSGNERLIRTAANYVSPETVEENRWKPFPPNATVFAKVGAALLLNRRRMLCCPTLIDNNMMAAAPMEDIDPLFLFYSLQSLDLQRLVAVGALPSVNQRDLNTARLPLPPRKECERIAGILSTCDDAIEKTGDLINAKKLQKKALMQQLLTGKKRLPRFEGDGERKEYRFFDLPSDWACPHVREVAQERSERCGDSDSHTVLACSKHLGFVDSRTYFKKQVFSEDTSNYKVVRRGWFGFPSNHVEEGSIGLLSTHDSGIVSPIYCVFETSPQIAPDYLYAVFKSETFRHIFSVTTNASVDRRGSLRWDAFGAIRVPCPTLDEQIAIADVNKAAADEIDTLQKKLEALKKQKKGLMQKLLTGQVRVKV